MDERKKVIMMKFNINADWENMALEILRHRLLFFFFGNLKKKFTK